MIASRRLRKLLLTAHVVSSVGWLGAVGVFLALSLIGLTTDDTRQLQAAILAMDSTGRFVIVPAAFASLLTGLVQSLGTQWGLFRYYWVVAKLVINLFAIAVLLLYVETLRYFADIASHATLSGADLKELRNPSPTLHATAALVLLLIATILAVYKPRGLTGYGRRVRLKHERVSSIPSS